MAVSRKENPEISQYLPEGDFNPRRTLSGSFFVIFKRLASICAVVIAFTANKQTNSQLAEAAHLRQASTALMLRRRTPMMAFL